MTEKRPLFRPEAVEHHARGQLAAGTLDLGERRTTLFFRGLLVTAALAVSASFAIRVDVTVEVDAQARADGLVIVPVREEIEIGDRVVATFGAREQSGVIRRIGGTYAATNLRADPGTAGSATVVVGSRTVADMLLGRG